MMAVIKWTLWQKRYTILWWSIGIAAFIFINMVFYPTFKDQAAELQKSFDNLPKAAVQLFGGSTDFFSPVGFLNSQVFFFMLPLLLGILAIILGSSLLAKEEQDKTIESLLSRPISRSNFLLAKTLAGVCIVSCVTFVGLFITLITARIVNLPVPIANIAIATLACFILALSFGAIALLFTAIGKARVLSVGVATTVAIGGYLISSLAGTVSWLNSPSKVFPFHYYRPEAILRGYTHWVDWLFFAVIIGVCAIISWASFRRRDIT